MNKERILVVDDEESLCEILQFNLEAEGYSVDVAYSAEQALEMDLTQYSLLLLDVMMGEMSGFHLARQLRQDPKMDSVAIIFCTAKDTEDDTITGLNLGADDYISKPFSLREVSARVKTVLRRSKSAAAVNVKPDVSERLQFETLSIDLTRKICTVDDQVVSLTKKELEILLLLLSKRGVIFSREEILQRVWSDEVIVLDRTIDVNITRLRKKIGRYGEYIVTRLGYGYGFEG